jgi:hypothetical protein
MNNLRARAKDNARKMAQDYAKLNGELSGIEAIRLLDEAGR